MEAMNLDELVESLVSGQPLARTDMEPFVLDTADSRKIFAFYGSNRQLWETSKQIRAEEIDNILEALDDDLPDAVKKESSKAQNKPVWHLGHVEIHRFAGIHQHLDQNGETPEDLVLDLNRELTLLSGFNGAGKTALLSAITWCLTGRALRSQDMPQEIHEPMSLKHVQELQDGQDPVSSKPSFRIPPIVPMPTEANLTVLEGKPKLDTSVKLTLVREDTEEIREVSRCLKVRGKTVTVPVTGLDELDLPSLAIEVGTLMPAIASHMRFNEETDLAQAVSELTGLKPLEQLGGRSRRMIDRLRKEETRKTTKSQDESLDRFKNQLQTFEDIWNQNPDLGEIPQILPPGTTEDQRDCQTTLADTRERMVDSLDSMGADIQRVLGRRLNALNQQALDKLKQAINEATDQLKTVALRGVPSIGSLMDLGEISDDDVGSSLGLIQEVLRRARELEERLKNESASARWILYSRVARWHRETNPGAEISDCPVCETPLNDDMIDALIDESVKSALNSCLESDADAAKNAIEWEKDEAAAFLNGLPQSMRRFADTKMPHTLDEALRKGYADELLGQRAFHGLLEPLQERARELWDACTRAHPRQEPPVHVESELPPFVANGELQQRVSAIGHALWLRTQLISDENSIKSILADYIGSDSPEEKNEEHPTHTGITSETVETEGHENRHEPLLAQINTVRLGLQNIAPTITLIRQLDDLESTRKEWEVQQKRLTLLERAAVAMQPFLTFRKLVHERVEGLIAILNEDTSEWLQRIYSAHYNGGPDYGGIEPTERGKLTVNAKFGNVLAPAHQVMNASLLKACVWAFLFSLWSHVKKQSGILSCMLLDDPQTHFDFKNCENLARTIPIMPSRGMRPVVTCNDSRFLAQVRNEIRSAFVQKEFKRKAFRINPISASRATANLGLWDDEINGKRERWRKDENDVSKAQDFVTCVRVDIEERLLNLLTSDPLALDSQRLAGILNRLRTARNNGELPFNEPPFNKLLTDETLKPDARFYDTIGKAHHRPSEITPHDATIVDGAYNRISSLLESCEASYTRFRLRSENTVGDGKPTPMPSLPSAVLLPDVQLTSLGQLAAQTDINLLASDDEYHQFNLDSLGPFALYAVRRPSLGLIALPSQVVIASLEIEAVDGDLVVALYGDRTFLRRFHVDKNNPTQVVLASDRSGTENVPTTLIFPRVSTRVLPIIGVLYDSQKIPGKDEAIAIEATEILTRQLVAAEVSEDSAYPVINNGDIVLMEETEKLTPEKFETLRGRIIAMTARNGSESFSYLKRLGQELGDGRYICENIGTTGTSVCVALNESCARGNELWLDRLWRVHGFIRAASIV